MSNYKNWGEDQLGPDNIAVDRLWRQIERRSDDECWPFRTAVERNTYGLFNLGAKYNGRRVTVPRLILILKLGRPLRSKMYACHICDWPPCCNPAHLVEGTPRDNSLMRPIEKRRVVGAPKGHKKRPEHGEKQRNAQYGLRWRVCSCGFETNAGAMSWHLRNREDHFIVSR